MILRLVDLPWYDVIYRHIFIRLDLRDLCNLRCLSSTEYRVLVDNYIATWDTLDISSYTDFEPNSFEELVKGCKRLRRVDLSNSYWLGSSHLVDLLGVHPGLTHLDLTGCNGPQMRCDFIEITKCRNLTSVRLRGCDWVTADFLLSLVRYNRNLRRLVLADCYQISDEAVESMFEFLTTLTDLSLEKTAITDKSLLAMIEHGVTAIEYLDLRYCHGITDYGLMLLRPLRSMKKLWILGCRSITERGLASFRERTDIDLPQRPICAIRPLSLQV
ncbi:F-box/LRR-repeat protein 15 isoform X2 [Vespula maculifrons]|nr:F-box/LRR-repeat protein 15-like isoform X1 [Vespula pensylvanica]XP_050855832.1 F-box/LRR-repeat protein 15-like isoform X1 [Vespula vulgaris]